MPRLVSLTLLSVLVLPAAALVYTLAVAAGLEWFGWNAETRVWLGADVLTFAVVVIWWTLLWGRSVEWTARMISLTLLATGGSLLMGVLAGIPAALVIDEAGFGMFIGGGVAVVSWLVSACILWRRGGKAQSAMAGLAAADLVICPKCGYALNGLREARCPECGEAYTLDGLFRSQPERQSAGDL